MVTIHRFPARKPNRRPGSCPVIPLFPGSDPMAEPDPSFLATATPGDREAEMFCRAEVSRLHRQIVRELTGRMTAAGVTAILQASR
jgi:hypothetical protein